MTAAALRLKLDLIEREQRAAKLQLDRAVAIVRRLRREADSQFNGPAYRELCDWADEVEAGK